jgi:hypothetical protein
MAIEVTDFLLDINLGSMIIFTDDRAELSVELRAVVLESLIVMPLGKKIEFSGYDKSDHWSQSPVRPLGMARCLPFGIALVCAGQHIGYRYYKALKFDDGKEILGVMLVEGATQSLAAEKLKAGTW